MLIKTLKKDLHRLLIIFLSIFTTIMFEHSSYADETFFTIQAGTYSFNSLDRAGKMFNMLSKKLNKDEIALLRIEEGPKHFVVRLGGFRDKAAADKALKKVKVFSPNASILKESDLKNKKVLIYYDDDEKASLSELTDSEVKQAKQMINNDIADIPAAGEPSKSATINDSDMINKLIDDASAHFYNQNYAKASELLRKGLAKWPDDPTLHAWYGATLLDTGFPDRAYEEYRKAAALLPDVPEFHSGVGHSLLQIYMDRAKKSVEAFKKALEIDPYNVSALEGLGIVYVSMEKKYLATEIYERLKNIDGEAAARLNQFIVWGVDWGEIK